LIEPPQRRLPVTPPSVPAPPPFTERRVRIRRDADVSAQVEIAFLARSMDVLAGVGSAEERLAALLGLIAETAGARRAAILADRGERRVASSIGPDEDPGAAEALAAWLDASAPRTRAERAASAPAIVSLAMAARSAASSPAEEQPEAVLSIDPASDDEDQPDDVAIDLPPVDDGQYACVAVPNSATVVLGFDFGDAAAREGWEARFPAAFARHAGAAIALVSDELAAERELETLRAQDVERTRFVSTVAHELRTPLTGLGGYLELILAGNVDDPRVEREFLERSRDIVSSMDELVGDLLELSRLESGSLQLDLDAFSVAEIGQRVLEHLAPIAFQRSVTLTSQLPPRLRAARGDRRRVEQILKNLLGNALKFTPAGGAVQLAGWFDGPVAVLAVRDDGLGISDEDRIRIFERFYRMASHERVNGTGLGLPIARELARAMGGDLDVASVPRAGSSFVLVLPGPRPVERAAIVATLDHTLDVEHDRLEDQAMLRRLQFLGRESAALRTAAPTASPAGAASSRPVAAGSGAVARLDALDASRGRMIRRVGEPPIRLRVVDPEPPGS
jgi:signal transduction histidine kinase